MMQAFEPGRTLPAKSLDFWFDYTCPYAYLGSTFARDLASRMGVALTYRPLLLGGVFKANGTPQELFASLPAAKSAHGADDMQRWAKRCGVTLRMPASHPMRSVSALRATIATDMDPTVIDAFYRAYWVENADIASKEIVRAIVERAGHDGDRVMAAIETEAVKDDLRRRTDEAIALGIFGVPSWVVDGVHMYWGQDRVAFVEGTARQARGAGAGAGTGMKKSVEAHWDFSSPFAYLAATQIAEVARRSGAEVIWRPLLLGGLFRAIGTPDVPIATFSEAKQRYIRKDLDRWAAYLGVPFTFPSRFPVMSLKALRVYLALPEASRDAYRERMFAAIWAHDRDATDDAVIASCIASDVREVLARAESAEVKAALRSATERAASEGVFGVPTFVTTTRGTRELFWGQDRLDLVEARLNDVEL